MKAALVALVALLALGGCRSERAETARANADRVLGLDRSGVDACAGAPDARSASDGREVWVYYAGDPVDYRSFAAQPGVRRYCEARVRFGGDGRVDDVAFGGSAGGILGRGAECAELFRRCR